MPFSLSKTVRSHPALPYEHMKNDILGDDYILSLVFVGDTRSQRLNKEYRKKTYTPNVLSFPLQQNCGEIYINPHQAKKEARDRGMSYRQYVGHLFIHGLLHLKGMVHGNNMEHVEARYLKRYFS